MNDQLISQVEGEIADDDLYDDALGKASADYYERSWKRRIENQQLERLDIWIAATVYLLLSSVAFVVL